MTSARWLGLAGILGGVLWAVLFVLRNLAFDSGEPILGLSYEDYGGVTVLPLVLTPLALRALRRATVASTGRLASASYRWTLASLTFLLVGFLVEFWFANNSSRQDTPGARLAGVLEVFGMLLAGISLLPFAASIRRATGVPSWALAGPLLLGITTLGIFPTTAIVGEGGGLAMGVLQGVGWVLVGAAVWASQSPMTDVAPITFREVRQALFSRGTLLSGVVAVAVWSLEWEWLAGLFVVLLLYAHELGHVAAAFWRGVRVQRAPFFLPGLGAFVETAPGAAVWDDVWISLGGPIVGMVAALLAKSAGLRLGIPALAQAGDFAVLVNAFNLAPFSPLDGGRVATRTGWFGLLLTVALGGALLLQGLDLFLVVLVVLGGLQALRSVLKGDGSRWTTHLSILLVYLGIAVLLAMAPIFGERVTWQPSNRPPWLPSLSTVFETAFWIYVLGAFALPYAWRPEQGALVRYGLAALLGWPRYLLGRQPWMAVVAWGLLVHLLGLPTLGWLEAFVRRQPGQVAGGASAFVYDCLVRQGRAAEASAWLERVSPALTQPASASPQALYLTLLSLGYETTATTWLAAQARSHADLPGSLTPSLANSAAWDLLTDQHDPASALPFARAAVAGLPGDADALDTLGQVLVGLDQGEEAATHLAWALTLEDRPGTRVALARALAQQSRYAEAVAEAERALVDQGDDWPDGEPGAERIEAWLRDWRQQAATEAPVG